MTPEERLELQEQADEQTWAYTVAFVKTAIKAVLMGIVFIWLPTAIFWIVVLGGLGWLMGIYL